MKIDSVVNNKIKFHKPSNFKAAIPLISNSSEKLALGLDILANQNRLNLSKVKFKGSASQNKLTQEEIERREKELKEILNSSANKRTPKEQISDFEIRYLAKKLDEKQFNHAKELLYIEGRKEQFNVSDISALAKLDEKQFARVRELLYIEGRKEQFDKIDIERLALMLDDEQFKRAKQLLYIEDREEQLSRVEIDFLATNLDDEQFARIKQALNIKGFDGKLTIQEIAALASLDNPQETIDKLNAQKQIIYNNPDRYVNDEYDSYQDMIKTINYYFKDNYKEFLQLASVFDKETLDVLFRMRFDDVMEYVLTISSYISISPTFSAEQNYSKTIEGFNSKDFKILKQLVNSNNIDGKPFMPIQKIQFIDLLDGYKKYGLDYSKMETMISQNRVDIAQLNIDLFNQIMKNLGLTDEEIALIPEEKLTSWDMKYMHLLAKETNEDEDSIFSDIIRATNLGNFESYIQDKSNKYGKTNANTKAKFEKMNMDYKKWLHPSKDNEVRFVSKDKNLQQLAQIASQIEEDMNTLMQTPAKGFIKKQFPKFIKDDKFIIPDEYIMSKVKLAELVEILSDTSQQGQLEQLWKRAQGNLTNPDTNRVNNARNTLTILDHLNQRKDDISKVQDIKATKTLDLTIKMWDRNPQKDLFQGNYSTCCIGMGGGNGSAMPHYLLDTAYNMIEFVDNTTGKTIGNALCYFVKDTNGQPIFIVDNIEINNSKKPSDEVGIKLRASIAQYASNVAKEVVGRDDISIYMSGSYNDVPCDDLKAAKEKITFLGDIDCNEIYMDLYDGWVEKEDLSSECDLLRLK